MLARQARVCTNCSGYRGFSPGGGGKLSLNRPHFYILTRLRKSGAILIIIIIIIIVSFMQGIHTHIPETNHVPRGYSVTAILSLLFMVPLFLVPAFVLLFFYVSTYYYNNI